MTLHLVICLFTDIKLLSDDFNELNEWDSRIQKVRVIVVLPQCSASALCNPVEFLLNESGGAAANTPNIMKFLIFILKLSPLKVYLHKFVLQTGGWYMVYRKVQSLTVNWRHWLPNKHNTSAMHSPVSHTHTCTRSIIYCLIRWHWIITRLKLQLSENEKTICGSGHEH